MTCLRPPLAALCFVLASTAAQAGGWGYFRDHVHPTGKCFGAREVAASYYSDGSRTCTGERFNPGALTAASRPGGFALGSSVTITNPENGRSVTVRINDCGPWGPAWAYGVRLDLSPAAFRQLGMRATQWVCAQ
jgi:rare lipoprotein A